MSNGEVKSSRVDETSGGNKRQLRSTVAPTPHPPRARQLQTGDLSQKQHCFKFQLVKFLSWELRLNSVALKRHSHHVRK